MCVTEIKYWWRRWRRHDQVIRWTDYITPALIYIIKAKFISTVGKNDSSFSADPANTQTHTHSKYVLCVSTTYNHIHVVDDSRPAVPKLSEQDTELLVSK